ncbi:MAG: nitrilase-related carbon-nitrogen hydrolase [Planctomycetota bacterium]|jgi:apolipoprotein N-acyltransferase
MKKTIINRLIGLASGLLMAAGNMNGALAPLQVVALIPVFYLGASKKVRHSDVLSAGCYMGLAFIVPQLALFRFPIPVTVVLLVHFTIVMTVLVWGSAYFLRRGTVLDSFAVGAFVVLLNWTNFTILPMWGEAQSLGRCWSSYPCLIQFTSLTGITGIIFVLATLQALVVNCVIRPGIRVRSFTAAIILFGICAAVNIAIISERPVGKMKVAAVGWIYTGSAEDIDVQTDEGFESLFAGPVAQAAGAGAKMVVSGELGFYLDQYDRDKWFERFGSLARKHNVFLVIGYLNAKLNEDRLLFMNPEGAVLSEYTKTYLVPFEGHRKGTGQISFIDIGGVRTGGMVCQDDNYTILSRQCGQNEAGVVAVPTLDWAEVKNAHLQSSIHRAIESRYAIVRATINGISAIISPAGKMLARQDHFTDGPGVIIAEVPVYKTRTVFSILGHWPVVVSAVFLAMCIGRDILQRKSRNQDKMSVD